MDAQTPSGAHTVVAMAIVVGISLGLIAGFFRGPVEITIMRLMDIILTLPSLLPVPPIWSPLLKKARAGVGDTVDVELEVEDEASSVDVDGHLLAVADPLGAREEGAERAARGGLVGGPAATPRRTA